MPLLQNMNCALSRWLAVWCLVPELSHKTNLSSQSSQSFIILCLLVCLLCQGRYTCGSGKGCTLARARRWTEIVKPTPSPHNFLYGRTVVFSAIAVEQ